MIRSIAIDHKSKLLNGDYKCALKWKIHDTSGRLGSSEDTFTQVYVYDLTGIHKYDRHNTFGIDPGIYNTSIAATSNNLMIV